MYGLTKILLSKNKFTTLILCRAMMTTIVLLEAWNNAWRNIYEMKKKNERPVVVTKSEPWRKLILKSRWLGWVSFSWAPLLTQSGQSLVISYPDHNFLIRVWGDGSELLFVFNLFLSAEKTDTAFTTSLRSPGFLLILFVRWHDLDWLLFRPVA